jgi:hypothetical protein
MSEAEALFAGREPVALDTYRRLIEVLEGFGPFAQEAKKTSIHLACRSAFAGVHPRKAAILLNIRSSRPISSDRIRKLEKVSANRWHNEMLLEAPDQLDAELTGWLREAYELSA